MKLFKLPDLGEGLPDAQIHEWHVNEGEYVEVDQLLVSMETAKAVVEVPSPYSGIINKLYGKAGDIIETGQPLVEFNEEKSQASDTPKASQTSERISATVAGKLEVSKEIMTENPMGIVPSQSNQPPIKATPAVRALAKKLAVDLTKISPSGKQGEITLDDVTQAASYLTHPTHTTSQDPHFQDMEPLKGVRRTMAQIMAHSHAEVVPVVIVDDADIHHIPDTADLTTLIIKAIVYAVQKEPALNAYFDGKHLSRKIFSHVNLGLAMDKPEGLFVPVIKEVEKLSHEEIRNTIERYKQQVAERTIAQPNLQGATISLSNFGTFAGRYANPIVVPPAVAIIGTGRFRQEVVAVGDKIEIHKKLPISVSFDHRAATGGEASRFLRALIDFLQDETLRQG